MPVDALVDDCPLYDLRPRSPTAPLYPAARGDARRGPIAARDAARAARLAEHRFAPAALSSSTTASCSRGRCAAPASATPRCSRCRPATAWRRPIDCNGRRVAADPYTGDDRGGAGVRVEPRVRRRRAAGDDEQPELRQPREARDRVAADGGGPRPRRRLPRAGGPDRRRQRLALQPGRRPARSTRRPSSAWSASCPTSRGPAAWASSSAVTRSRSSAGTRRSPPVAGRRELAKLRGEALPDGLPAVDIEHVIATQAPCATRSAPGRCSSATTWPRAGWLSPGRVRAWRAASARRVEPRRRRRTRRSRCSARPPAASSSRAPREALEALAGPTSPDIMLGEVGGDVLTIGSTTSSCRCRSSELHAAHGALAELFP